MRQYKIDDKLRTRYA